MDRIELVELVRSKAGVGYVDAKAALDASNDDLLDALVWLELQGVAQTGVARVSTDVPAQSGASAEMRAAQNAYERSADAGVQAMLDWLKLHWDRNVRYFKETGRNRVVRYKDGVCIMVLPLHGTIAWVLLWALLAIVYGVSNHYYNLITCVLDLAPFAFCFYLMLFCHIEKQEDGGEFVSVPGPVAPEKASRSESESVLEAETELDSELGLESASGPEPEAEPESEPDPEPDPASAPAPDSAPDPEEQPND